MRMPLLLPIFLITLASAHLGAVVTSNCTEECAAVCECIATDNGCNVKCLRKNLHKIPSPLPTDVTLLDLSNNRIHSIPAMAFSRFKKLKTLRIDNNALETLHPDSFRGMTQLRELSLENNWLTLSEKTFATYLFNDMVHLKRLKLRGNDRFNGDYLDHSITTLTSLETLYIVGFSGKIFGPKYKRLKRLRHISFSSTIKPSIMKIIAGEAFKNVPGLTYLNLSNCGIHGIDKNAFSYLTVLKNLDLSHNRHLTFRGLRYALYGLRNIQSLEFLNISAVNKVFGLGTVFDVEDAVNLQNISLKRLYMDSNKLEFFKNGALFYFPKTLEYLSIKDNRFSFGWYIFQFYQLPSIKIIDASFKSSEHNLPSFPSQNFFDTKSGNVFNSSTVTLEVLLFRECYLKYPIPRINFRTMSMIRYINASGNLLCPWKGPLIGLERMTWLDLSNNMCTDASDTFFHHFYSLRKLYIHDNLLGISKTLNGFNLTFRNLTKLESLRLSNNRISSMSNYSLISQTNLNYLDLGNNFFQTFTVKIGHMRNLAVLDLSNNFLKSLSMNTLKEIENISSTRNIMINLNKNQLKCSCHHIRFLKWVRAMRDSKTIRLIYDRCFFSNGTKISLKGKTLDRVVEFLNKSCDSLTSLIIAATVAILALVALLIGGLIYRYRWNLRYFFYMMKHRYSQKNENPENYTFDAFVSYAEEDEDFVFNEMLPELEENGNLRLNIHQRDFVPGRKIVENILVAVQQSKFCLAVLSRSFLSSKWCMYEFSMAKMETVYAERDMVVVIMLEEVDNDTIPLDLLHHLKTNSYIQYPVGDDHAQERFWNHIRGLLRSEEENI